MKERVKDENVTGNSAKITINFSLLLVRGDAAEVERERFNSLNYLFI